MAKYNQAFFQIPATGVDCEWASEGGQQSRSCGMRMSNFGALAYGARNAADYTKLVQSYQSKDELQNPLVPSFAQDGEFKTNPFVWGSTVKRVLNDELRIMSLGSRAMDGDALPTFDVMDTNLSRSTPKDGDMTLNWPNEGYKPFGGRVAGPFGV